MVSHQNRSNPIRRSTVCYLAHGRTYLADGWSPSGPLFSVIVPVGDERHALDYARAYRNSAGSGTLVHGAHDVERVEPVRRAGRSPRNADREDRGGLGRLPLAPDGSLWSLVSVMWESVTLLRHASTATGWSPSNGERVTLTWSDLRAAAAGNDWYADVHRRAKQAAL